MKDTPIGKRSSHRGGGHFKKRNKGVGAGDKGYSPAEALKQHAHDNAKKPRGSVAQASVVGFCGAKKRGGGTCHQAAGWGTEHYGIGACKNHGGAAPTSYKSAIVKEANQLLGMPLEINPLDALLWCIRIRAGEVKWLSDRMVEIEEKHWIEETIVGKQFHLYARERKQAMNDLARYSQIAISIGLAERAVRLAEQYGDLLAKLLKGIFDGMVTQGFLTDPEAQKAWQLEVRKNLIAISAGGPKEIMPVVDGKATEAAA